MLEAQMQLGAIQERTLKRKIEALRRKRAGASATSFDLTRELSMEIERTRAAKSESLICNKQRARK